MLNHDVSQSSLHTQPASTQTYNGDDCQVSTQRQTQTKQGNIILGGKGQNIIFSSSIGNTNMAEGSNKVVDRGGLCIDMKKALNKEGRELSEEEKKIPKRVQRRGMIIKWFKTKGAGTK